MVAKQNTYLHDLQQRLRDDAFGLTKQDSLIRQLFKHIVHAESNVASRWVLVLSDDNDAFHLFKKTVGQMLWHLKLIDFIKPNGRGFSVRPSFHELVLEHLQALKNDYTTLGDRFDPWEFATAPLLDGSKPVALQSLILAGLLLDKTLAECV
jgi:hypothetical protein